MAAPTINPYLRTKVLTASPQELRLMLYDGALKFCRQAKPALEEKRYEDSYNNLVRVQNIVLELSNSLNHKAAPELCDRLAGLYTYLYRRLVEANVNRDVAIVDEVIELIEYERETWQMLMERQAQEAGHAPRDQAPAADQPPTDMPRFSQSA
ncbi:MAG: flagellar export chaperone FliS [Phycisphaeraceae bacterium]